MKIFLAGPSGSGKTTLAKYIASRYRITFENFSSTTLMKDYAISNHQDIISKTVQDPAWGLKFQYNLVQNRQNIIIDLQDKDFIADRSTIDSLVYFMLQNLSGVSNEQTLDFITYCANTIDANEDSIYIYLNMQVPYENGIGVEHNSKRITNIYYQTVVNEMFQKIIGSKWLPLKGKLYTINVWDWEERIKQVDRIINHRTTWQRIKDAL